MVKVTARAFAALTFGVFGGLIWIGVDTWRTDGPPQGYEIGLVACALIAWCIPIGLAIFIWIAAGDE